jgi:anti-anti-sigma factor
VVKPLEGDQDWPDLHIPEDVMLQDRPGTPISTVCSVDSERQPGTATIRLYGEFDLSSEEPFQEKLATLLDGDLSTLVLDLRELTFMDSTGLRVLISLKKRADDGAFDYVVLCDNGTVRRLLQVSGMDGVLPVVDSNGPVPVSEPPR